MPSTEIDAQFDVREEDLPNFQVVSPEMFRGGQPNRAGFERLKKFGVKTIINLRDESYALREEEQLLQGLGFTYFSIALSPFELPPKQAIERFLEITVHQPYQPVFVHCLHGMDRTGTFVSIYRLESHGWSLDDAYAEMLKHGFHPHFTGLKQAVDDFAIRKRRQSELII